MRLITRGLKGVNRLVVNAQKGILIFVTLIIVIAMFSEVVARYVFEAPFFGAEVLIGYSAVWLYLIGAGLASYDRSHIKADILRLILKREDYFFVAGGISTGIAFLMSCLLVKWSYDLVIFSIRCSEVIPAARNLPMVYFKLPVLIGSFLMAVYFLGEAIDLFRQSYAARFASKKSKEASSWKH